MAAAGVDSAGHLRYNRNRSGLPALGGNHQERMNENPYKSPDTVETAKRSTGTAAHTVGQELKWIILFVAAIWGVFLLDCVVPDTFTKFTSYGLMPRTVSGAVGIVLMPFLHADWSHLLSNTVPLFVLLALLAGSKARSWEIVVDIILVGGVLLWIFGRHVTHVGASGLIFGLVAFLIVSGLLERRIIPLIVSVIVGFLYGSALISGVLPWAGCDVSWDGHLCGAVAGVLIAWLLTRGPKRKKESAGA